MAFSLNRITLIGNLGKDSETRFTASNLGVTTFSLATTHSYKGKDENWINETTWHNIVAFSLSDFMKDKLTKGKKFYVEGRLSKKNYEDKEGIKRYSTDVIVEKLIPLEGRDEFSQNSNSSQNNSSSAGSSPAPINTADENDDLPF